MLNMIKQNIDEVGVGWTILVGKLKVAEKFIKTQN